MNGGLKRTKHKGEHARLSDLQASVDRLLAEKLQLQQQVEELTKELSHLRDQVGSLHVHMRVWMMCIVQCDLTAVIPASLSWRPRRKRPC